MHKRVMALSQNFALVMVNKYVKFDKNSFSSTEAMVMSVFFPKSIKGDNLIKLHYKAMSICQKVALVMVNRSVKFYENGLNFVEVMAEICRKQAIFVK